MKFLFRPDKDRWHKQDAMKKSAYAFVPYQTHFGELCGFADDVVFGGQGFDMHPHENMEISTIVMEGVQAHRDDTGSKGIVDANTVQTMSAGTGIMHSEFNASSTDPFHSFQIWVYPKELSVTPRHETFSFQPPDKKNKILLALSPDKRNGTAFINQDAFFSISALDQNITIDYPMNLHGNGVYIHCAKGSIKINDFIVTAGDALGVYDTETIQVSALQDAELIFVEVPMQRGVKV